MLAQCQLTLSDLSDISSIVIAIANLGLAIYIIWYQIGNDRKTLSQTFTIQEQNIKLQWFKELIIQPNLDAANSFYKNLNAIKDKIGSNDLSEDEKIDLMRFVKNEHSTIRKRFVDILKNVAPEVYLKINSNLDNLIDQIIKAIDNDELKLKNPVTYEKEIGSKITYSQNDFISEIFNYKGTEIGKK